MNADDEIEQPETASAQGATNKEGCNEDLTSERELSDSDLNLEEEEVSLDAVEPLDLGEDDEELFTNDRNIQTRSGRNVNNINYKKLHRYGEQYNQVENEKEKNMKSGRTRVKLQDTFRHIVEMMMYSEATKSEYDQLNINEGIKRHGGQAIAAVIKEYEQLKNIDTVRPLEATTLTNKQKSDALEPLTLMKKNDAAR